MKKIFKKRGEDMSPFTISKAHTSRTEHNKNRIYCTSFDTFLKLLENLFNIINIYVIENKDELRIIRNSLDTTLFQSDTKEQEKILKKIDNSYKKSIIDPDLHKEIFEWLDLAQSKGNPSPIVIYNSQIIFFEQSIYLKDPFITLYQGREALTLALELQRKINFNDLNILSSTLNRSGSDNQKMEVKLYLKFAINTNSSRDKKKRKNKKVIK